MRFKLRASRQACFLAAYLHASTSATALTSDWEALTFHPDVVHLTLKEVNCLLGALTGPHLAEDRKG